jgi:hypothetical protein
MQLRKDYMNLVNKKLNNEQKLDDFISWISVMQVKHEMN